MGVIKKQALQTTMFSYIGLVIGYLNKGALFVILFSTDEVGLINLVVGIGMLLAQFMSFGVINSTWKFFPYLKNKDNHHHGFLTLNFLLILAGILVFGLLIFVFKTPITSFYIEKSSRFSDFYYLIIPLGAATATHRYLDSYLRAMHKHVVSIIANDVILRLSTTFLLAVYAFDLISFNGFLYSLAILQFIPGSILIVYLMKIKEWHISTKDIFIPNRFRKIIFSYSLFSYTNSIGALSIVTIDSMMIASFLGLGPTGVYTIVLFLIRALMIPYGILVRMSAPLISEYWRSRAMNKMDKLYKEVSSINLVIGLFCFLLFWESRVELFGFLPDDYTIGIEIFMYLMVGRLFDAYMGLNTAILVTSKKYKYDLIFTLSLIILVIILNYYFIPVWGVNGAAISTTISFILYNLARLIFIWKHYNIHPFKASNVTIIIFGTITLLIAEWIPQVTDIAFFSIAIKSAIVFALFAVPLYLLKVEPQLNDYVHNFVSKLKRK
ncbi:MAG: lipopolysaccharide biosynthesis protein [Crocinitomicaceae bacterium]|nr:lipopolysaccharide biosynthesis protein [Crocinitomicaceae bacterium]